MLSFFIPHLLVKINITDYFALTGISHELKYCVLFIYIYSYIAIAMPPAHTSQVLFAEAIVIVLFHYIGL